MKRTLYTIGIALTAAWSASAASNDSIPTANIDERIAPATERVDTIADTEIKPDAETGIVGEVDSKPYYAEPTLSYPTHDYLTTLLPTPQPKKPEVKSIYDLPYSISTSCPNYGRLAGNTTVLFAGGLTMLAILQMMPEDATAWNKAEIDKTPMFQRWYDHVMRAPVFDKDNAIFNYVLHPYAGAAYYMSARSQGFNLWQSWLYSFAVSTFFWEYGIEAFNEIPSINDLIITPMGGLILGESFYLAKRYIVEHDYEVLGTKWLGYPIAFLLDPVNECLGWFRGNNAHGYSERAHADRQPKINMTPSLQPVRGGGLSYGVNLNITF